ncbi:hypothetical protein BH10ACT11_BH10ACT11_19130 [soil metagenome]
MPSRLRPSKIKSGLRRRWFERRLGATPLRPIPGLIELGTTYGGWIAPGALIDPDWVCYCVGAGGDITFDLDLIERYGCTVRTIEAVASLADEARQAGGGVVGHSVIQAAIATSDGPLRMQTSHEAVSRSVSSAGLYDSEQFIELPGRTLPSLMAELGDERIDLLKLDIEGGEYAVLPEIDLPSLGVKVFSIQLHHTGSVSQAKGLIAELNRAGYVTVACRPVVKLTFVREDLLDAKPAA